MKAVLPGAAAVFFVMYHVYRNRQWRLSLALSVFAVFGYLCSGQAVQEEKFGLRLAEQLAETADAGYLTEDAAAGYRRADESGLAAIQSAKDQVTAEGIIIRLTKKENSTEYLLRDVTLKTALGEVWLEKLLVYASHTGNAVEGDKVSVEGTVSSFAPATNPGQFDYRAYQAAFNVYLQMYGEQVYLTEADASPVDGWLGCVRRYALEIFEKASAEVGGTMAAMVLGDKTNLPEERYQLYLDSGIGHILTLSGLHLSLFGVGLYGVLRRRITVPAWPASILMIGMLAAYVRLIGSGISAIRAAIAIFCSLLGGCLGKTYDSLSAAGLGMLLILTEYPRQIERPAFWLSFGAVFAMGAILPELTGWLKPRGKAAKALVSVLVIWLALMPVTAINQFVVQPYSLALNFLVVPMMGLLLTACILVLLLGIVNLSASAVLAAPVDYLFRAIDRLCELSLRLPGSQLAVGAPSYGQIIVYGGLLAGFFSMVCRRNRLEWERQETAEYTEVEMDRDGMTEYTETEAKRSEAAKGIPEMVNEGETAAVEKTSVCGENKNSRRADKGRRIRRSSRFLRWSSLLILCAVLTVVLSLDFRRNRLDITFLDVGQGDGICIRMPDGTTMVVDGGSSSEKQVGEYRIMPYLAWAGIDRIDYLVMTHLDEDHINGLQELLESGFPIECLLISYVTTKLDKVEEIKQIAQSYGIDVVYIKKNDQIICGEVEIICISPARESDPESENEASVVLELNYRDFSCLLTGDVEGDGERSVEEYVKNRPAYTLLKVAHHGSKYSTSEGFLAAVSPAAAVISCGRNNLYGHPHEELLERLEETGCEIYCTADCGAVLVSTDGESWSIRGFH